jgi:hypothetical protein
VYQDRKKSPYAVFHESLKKAHESGGSSYRGPSCGPPQRLPGGVRVPLQVGQRVLVVALELTGAGVTVGGYDGYRSSPLGPRLTATSYINQESLSEKNPSRLI